MSREIQIDFDALKAFLNGYNLSHLLNDASFNSFISQQHKKYFAYLTFIAEIQNFIDNPDYSNIILYISPQINRAVKNKSYFYNCYGKEEKFYIENQG